jgi:hypothetical protein
MKWLLSAALLLASPALAFAQWGGQFESRRSFSFNGGFRRERPVVVYLYLQQPQPFTTLPGSFGSPWGGQFSGGFGFNSSFQSGFGFPGTFSGGQ